MCRIFGFRSVLLSKVHSSLVSAENALMGQSRRHPDGWGMAYYLSETPHLVKSTNSAETDELFKSVSGIVTSQTVLAHIRKATHGKLSILNTHPFQFGRWTFAHNGNIKNFDQTKNELLQKVSPKIAGHRLGDTDSEVIFHIILSYLQEKIDLHDQDPNLDLVMKQLTLAIEDICRIIGELNINECGLASENYLTFVLTNGPLMLAMNGGQPLFYTTHKKRCPERDTCASFAPWCEALPTTEGDVNHLIFSSEPLQGENIWFPMKPGQIVALDHQMKLRLSQLSLPFAS